MNFMCRVSAWGDSALAAFIHRLWLRYRCKNIILKDLKHHQFPSLSFSLCCENCTPLHAAPSLSPSLAVTIPYLVNMNRVCITDPISGDSGAAIEAETHRSILQNRLTGEHRGWRGDGKWKKYFPALPALVCETSTGSHKHLHVSGEEWVSE